MSPICTPGSPSPPTSGAHCNVSNPSLNPCLTRKHVTLGCLKYCFSCKYILLNYKAPVSYFFHSTICLKNLSALRVAEYRASLVVPTATEPHFTHLHLLTPSPVMDTGCLLHHSAAAQAPLRPLVPGPMHVPRRGTSELRATQARHQVSCRTVPLRPPRLPASHLCRCA